jgi:DNA polymerase-3 subunit beta
VFQVNQKSLALELALLIQIAGQKNVIPALETIRFDFQGSTVSLLAYNGDVALFTETSAEGEGWKGCVPAEQLYDLVRLSSKTEEVVFTPQGSQIQIAWGRSRHKLPVTDFSAFPDLVAPVAKDERLSVKVEDFTPALKRVLPCTARDDTAKWMVRGIKLEAKEGKLEIIGTNTHRLGVANIPAEGQLDLFVPLKAAELLPRLKSEDLMIWHDGQQAVFNFGPRTLVSRLMTGSFPNWRVFMPEHLPMSASLVTEEMIGALKRADVTRDETFKTGVGRMLLSVVFIFGKEELVIDTRHSDVHGRSEESVQINSNLNGDLIYMGINPDYVMDFLRLAGPTTECFLKDGKSVLKLTDGSNFEYVVVPTRL